MAQRAFALLLGRVYPNLLLHQSQPHPAIAHRPCAISHKPKTLLVFQRPQAAAGWLMSEIEAGGVLHS